MTRYELLDIKAALEKASNFARNQSDLFQMIDAKKLVEKALQESESQGLDEAAEKYSENILANNEDLQDAIEDAFKPGAEWMAVQGVKLHGRILPGAYGNLYIESDYFNRGYKGLNYKFSESNDVDMFVQIRKK